jgi:hypothetical protein
MNNSKGDFTAGPPLVTVVLPSLGDIDNDSDLDVVSRFRRTAISERW